MTKSPKFGLAVTGIVHPEKLWRNTGAKPGDVIILTKPIGSGVLFNANLKNLVSEAAMDACIATISTLNKAASEVLQRYTVHAGDGRDGFWPRRACAGNGAGFGGDDRV